MNTINKYGKMAPILIAVLALGLFATAFIFTGTTFASQENEGFEPVSEQVWGVSVSADPGHEGSLSQSFEAAFGVNQDTGQFEDYFTIEQRAYTSSGETKRYIDISSPVSGAYVMEDMTVTGKTEIKETFMMDNMLQQVNAKVDWFSIF